MRCRLTLSSHQARYELQDTGFSTNGHAVFDRHPEGSHRLARHRHNVGVSCASSQRGRVLFAKVPVRPPRSGSPAGAPSGRLSHRRGSDYHAGAHCRLVAVLAVPRNCLSLARHHRIPRPDLQDCFQMTSFARDIQIVCFGTLVFLALYTLWLSRYRGLDGHLTVRWLLLLGVALLTILFWRYLPFFSVTSNLQERELLLMVTVLLFGFVV